MLTDFGTHPADRVPKAELHAHLEGTIHPPVLRMLAERNGINLPDGVLDADDNYLWTDFNDFLKILKEKYHKSGEHRPFFDMLANNKVTLIDTLESNLSSVISPQQAEDFLKTFSIIEDAHAQ